MMDGMSKETFLNYCDALNTALTKEINKEPKEEGEMHDDHGILFYANEIIDESHNIIQSEDENLVAIFHEVFNSCTSIKRHAYYVSHYQSEMRKNTDIEQQEKDATSFLINRRLLVNDYNRALAATAKAKELGMIK